MRRLLLFPAVLFTALGLPLMAWADPVPNTYYGHGQMWGGGWGSHMIFGPLMMVLFIAAIVVLVVLAFRWLGGAPPPTQSTPAGKTPLDILKERFARGEIDTAEFEERKRALGE